MAEMLGNSIVLKLQQLISLSSSSASERFVNVCCPEWQVSLLMPIFAVMGSWFLCHSSVVIVYSYLAWNRPIPHSVLAKWSAESLTWIPGPWFNIKMSSYQYRKSHCGDKTVVRASYLHNGISYTVKMSSLYWIRAQNFHKVCTFSGTNFLDENIFVFSIIYWH